MLFIGEVQRNDVTLASSVPVSHMRPPIRDESRTVQFCGSAALTAPETRMVKDFVDTQRRTVLASKRRQQIDQYAIHQESEDISPDDTLPRFSCATYVTGAYEQAAIELIDRLIPMKTLADLKQIYTDPQQLAALDDPAQRILLGIGAGSQWPILMVGYLLHSLARTPAQIRSAPYRPSVGDEYFPSNASTANPGLSSP